MNYHIRYQDQVEDDFKAIRKYWEEKLKMSPDRILDLIMKKINGLSSFPNSHRRLDDYPDLRPLVVEDYIVLYQVDERRHAVTIEYVYHGSRDLKKVIAREPVEPYYDLEEEEERER